jgi:ketosteroid isomerase-like protein
VSQENVDVVCAAYEWGNRTRELDLGDLFDPGFAWHTRVDLPDAGAREGHEGVTRLRAEWAETFDDFHVALDELIDAGDAVIVVARLRGQIRGSSGQQLDLHETHVWKLRDGRAIEVRAYLTRTEALKAVRLEK